MNDYYDKKFQDTCEVLENLWWLIKVCWLLAPVGWIIREIVT